LDAAVTFDLNATAKQEAGFWFNFGWKDLPESMHGSSS